MELRERTVLPPAGRAAWLFELTFRRRLLWQQRLFDLLFDLVADSGERLDLNGAVFVDQPTEQRPPAAGRLQ